MTCPICDGKVFTFKCVTVEVADGEMTYVAWVCDKCDEPLTDSDMMDKFIEEIGELWTRITKKKQ